jgi:predicted metalloprotease
MRWPLLVLLLALALGGCTIDVVSGADTPSGSAPTAEDTPSAAPADTVEDTTIDAQPAVDNSDMRTGDEQTAVRIVNAFWKSWFTQHHRRYVPPKVSGGYIGRRGPRCGGQPSVPGNAYYCPSGNFLAWDENLMRAGYTQIGDAWVYLVIAHEWGHAIQGQLPPQYVSQAVELQADCLAGAALEGAAQQGLVQIEPGDDEEIARTLEAVADDYPWTDQSSHGDAQQRIDAFRTGVSGGVDRCIGV